MHQISVSVAVPEAALNLTSLTAEKKSHAVGDLITIAFYDILRSGEYTKPIILVGNIHRG